MNMTPGIIQALSALRASGCDADADRIESSLTKAEAVEPVARVAEVHMSRYTIEWVNGPLPEGSLLYGSAPTVCWQHRPGSPCPWPASCRSNGCSAVERELFPDAHAPPAVPVESPASVPDGYSYAEIQAAWDAADIGGDWFEFIANLKPTNQEGAAP